MGSNLTSAFHRNKRDRFRNRLIRTLPKHHHNPKINYYAYSLAKHPTQAEIRFYEILKSMRLHKGLLFQSIILNYIVDFMLPKHRIAIEIDGSSHINKQEYDESRTKVLNENNIVVLRFSNQEVFENPKFIIDRLNSVMRIRRKQWRKKYQPKTKIYNAFEYSQEELNKLVYNG
jgi:very-short-patch-repair endonuclease